SIAIIRERVDNSGSPGSRSYQAALAAVIKRLAAVVGVDEQKMADAVKAHQRDPIFQPIDVVEHATDAQVAAVMARRLELPQVVVQEVPVRAYPSGGLGAHMVGYVSEVQKSQLAPEAEYAGMLVGSMVGQAGLEKAYNSRLMGIDG